MKRLMGQAGLDLCSDNMTAAVGLEGFSGQVA